MWLMQIINVAMAASTAPLASAGGQGGGDEVKGTAVRTTRLAGGSVACKKASISSSLDLF